MLHVNKVYFDMDGVLADFEGMVFKKTGCTRDDLYAMGLEKADTLVDRLVGSDPAWFTDLEPTRYFKAMIEFMEFLNAAGVEVNILTSMGNDFYNDFDVTTHMAKADWLDYQEVSELIKNMCTVPRCYMKQYYAEPDALLIDDKQSNCEQFSANGGVSIKVDLDWSNDDAVETFESAKRYMKFGG